MQRKQAAHMRSFTPAISGSRVSASLAKVNWTLEAAAEAWAAIPVEDADRLRGLVRPWSRAIVESGDFGLR